MLYSEKWGRPSLDQESAFYMMLAGYLFNRVGLRREGEGLLSTTP